MMILISVCLYDGCFTLVNGMKQMMKECELGAFVSTSSLCSRCIALWSCYILSDRDVFRHKDLRKNHFSYLRLELARLD